MTKNKQLLINLGTTVLVLVINTVINFFLSRYVVDYIGESAYGFISLANNFISYATIFTTAINSMASRFITLNIHQKKIKTANRFFSSVLIANIIIIAVLMIPSIILILYLDKVVNIPPELVLDVKILFLLIFINFFITLIGGVFTVATYCKNKLYLSSLRTMESTIIKFIIILFLFFLLKPSVFYVGIATLIASIYVLVFNVKYTKVLLPNIKIKRKYFSIKEIKILLSSGLWNSITNLGNVIADGLDLLISNIFVGATTMGVIAVAKVPGSAFNNIISSILTVFQPQTLEYYANNDTENTKLEIIKSMKISGILGNIPFSYIVIFGTAFCMIWMPNMDNKFLTILCILSFINVFTGGIISPLYNVFTITNNVKTNAIMALVSAMLSTLLVLLLLYTTDLGAFAIVGCSAIVGLIKGFIIVPIYAAKCFNLKWNTFFAPIMQYILATVIMIIIFYLIRLIFDVDNWINLFASIIICGILGLIINGLILLNKKELNYIKNKIKNKLFS